MAIGSGHTELISKRATELTHVLHVQSHNQLWTSHFHLCSLAAASSASASLAPPDLSGSLLPPKQSAGNTAGLLTPHSPHIFPSVSGHCSDT